MICETLTWLEETHRISHGLILAILCWLKILSMHVSCHTSLYFEMAIAILLNQVEYKANVFWKENL